MDPQIIFYDAIFDCYEDAQGVVISNLKVFLETCRKLRCDVIVRLLEQPGE